MKKKMVVGCIALAAMAGLVACGTTEVTQNSSMLGSLSAKKETKAEYTIGICQLVQHEDLDAATQGFMDAVKEQMGDRVAFEVNNAQGDSNTCSVIINSFVSGEVDLILANATPALQAAAAGTDTIPILGTCVTDYALALDLKDFDGTVGGNISGTSDVSPLDQQAEAIRELFPDKKKVGMLSCSAEINAKTQIDEIRKLLTDMGYECTDYTFSDSNDLAAVVRRAAEECDFIYTPTDNTVSANSDLINNICLEAKIPIFTGSESICEGCGAATLCLDAYELGYATGEMAVKVLEGTEDISKMPIQSAPKFVKKYNPKICKILGISVPEDYEPLDP